MITIIYYFIIRLIFSLAILAITTLVSYTFLINREIITIFECGFDGEHKARTPFSLRFFLLIVFFLIFDVEIAFLIPSIIFIKRILFSLGFNTFNIFIIILLLGIIHEINEGSLDWIK